MRTSVLLNLFAACGLMAFQVMAQQAPMPQQPAPAPPPPSAAPPPKVFNFFLPVPKALCEAAAKQLVETSAAKTVVTTEAAKLMATHAQEITAHYDNPQAPDKTQPYAQALTELGTALLNLNNLLDEQAATLAACRMTIPNSFQGAPGGPSGAPAQKKVVMVAGLGLGRTR